MSPERRVVCYQLFAQRSNAQNQVEKSLPVRACVDIGTLAGLTRTADGTASSSWVDGLSYVTEPAEVVVVDPGPNAAPERPAARVYAAYQPWGDPQLETVLEAQGFNTGLSLFVHPVEDLTAGIPEETAVVLVPSASDGDRGEQISTVNSAGVQRVLRRFVEGGGKVVLHRWSAGGVSYRLPVPSTGSRRFAGYDVYRYGEGIVYATAEAVDHPEAGPLGRRLYRLLERIRR